MPTKSKPTTIRRPGRRRCDAHRREIERALREFLDYASQHPLHRFAAGTRKFLEEVRPLVEQLDAIDCATPEA